MISTSRPRVISGVGTTDGKQRRCYREMTRSFQLASKEKKKKKALEKGTDRILVLPLRCLGMRDRQGSV